MNKFGIGNVSYTPICSSEEMKLEMKKTTGNEIVKKMWDKLDDEEQGFINVMIDRDNKQNEEIERLNNIINELEKWLVEEQNLTCGCGITRDYLYAFDECLDKLQELKGSDRE